MRLAAAPLGFLVLATVACASPRPVLYPNESYRAAGRDAAERDIDQCVSLAEQFKARPRNDREEDAIDVVEGAAVGGATGAAVGAVVGNVGRGAAVGAAGGGARVLARKIFRRLRGKDSRDTYTTFHLFVERCLERRGYEIVGWE